MELLDIEEKREMSREEAAALLHEIADSLARHNGLQLMKNGVKLQIKVPAKVEFEFEVEVKDKVGKSSLELEISW
jgi:amphi-Trp domain-containing protein